LLSWLRRAALGAALVLCLPAPALAITNGAPDTAHPAVGLLVADGGATPVCSGTLVAPTVFLTAGHCVLGHDASTLAVRFDNGLVPATGAVIAPGYPKTSDVAIVQLARPAGVAPAAIARSATLDRIAKGASLTAVGYGYYDRVTGGGQPRFLYDGVRRVVTSPLSVVQADWIKLSSNDGGVCFGDSGAPWLSDGAIVAIVSSGSASCSGNSNAYRLDTPAARAFLAPYLNLL
jgi:hypothetical protein